MTANAGFSQPYFIVTWAESGVAVILLSARCYTAARILHHVATDLYLALVTFVRHQCLQLFTKNAKIKADETQFSRSSVLEAWLPLQQAQPMASESGRHS